MKRLRAFRVGPSGILLYRAAQEAVSGSERRLGITGTLASFSALRTRLRTEAQLPLLSPTIAGERTLKCLRNSAGRAGISSGAHREALATVWIALSSSLTSCGFSAAPLAIRSRTWPRV
jgi:hypothetical protein